MENYKYNVTKHSTRRTLSLSHNGDPMCQFSFTSQLPQMAVCRAPASSPQGGLVWPWIWPRIRWMTDSHTPLTRRTPQQQWRLRRIKEKPIGERLGCLAIDMTGSPSQGRKWGGARGGTCPPRPKSGGTKGSVPEGLGVGGSDFLELY